MLEIRGITITNIGTTQKIKLLLRGSRGDDYQTLDYPYPLALTKSDILTFLGHCLNIKPDDIVWAPHVKIPGEK